MLHARPKVRSSGRGPWPFVSDSRGAEREAARIKSAPPSAACCPHPLPPAMPALAPPPAVAAVAAAEAAATHCCRRCRQCHCHRNCRRHCRPCCPPPNPPTHQPRTPAGTTMPSNPPAAPPQPPANNSSTSVQSCNKSATFWARENLTYMTLWRDARVGMPTTTRLRPSRCFWRRRQLP